MRILFLSSLYPPHTKGGAELSTHYIAQGLRQMGHDLMVITSSPAGRLEEVVNGVPVLRLPLPFTAKPLFERSWARRLAQALTSALAGLPPFDIVHCHDFRTAQVVSQMDLPNCVVTVRDYAFICGSPNNILADGSLCPGCEDISTVVKNRAVVEAPWWRKPFRVWQFWHNIEFRKASLKAFPHRIYISGSQEKIIQQRLAGGAKHQTVIYNPIPAAYASTRPVRPVAKTILYVGTVESYKGVGLLLEAFRKLSEQHNDVQLKIVGEGAQRTHFEGQVARWGLQYRVTFTGRVAHERMLSIYDEAWLVVAPHIWPEPFGRTVVEAMARERLVVAARLGGPAELIQDGRTGFLFESGSVPALQDALATALAVAEIDRREIQQAARTWAIENLSIQRIAKNYDAFYRQMGQL